MASPQGVLDAAVRGGMGGGVVSPQRMPRAVARSGKEGAGEAAPSWGEVAFLWSPLSGGEAGGLSVCRLAP